MSDEPTDHVETKAIHAGQKPEPVTGAVLNVSEGGPSAVA